jgi:TonB family protein
MRSRFTRARPAQLALSAALIAISGFAACTTQADAPVGTIRSEKNQTADARVGAVAPDTLKIPSLRASAATTSQGQELPYFEFQVEKQVRQIPGPGNLRYPDKLRFANIEGEVLTQFVVDQAGNVEPASFKVLKSSHELFTAAVRNALPNMRFHPAEIGGRKVRQVVQQPFTFSLSRN